MIPQDLRERVTSDIWKKNVAAPVERKPGVVVIAVDDPQDLTRLDAIRAMNLSPRYEVQVGMKHDILAYIAKSYNERYDVDGTTSESADWARILDSTVRGASRPIAQYAISLWCAPQSVIVPPE